MRNLLTRRPSPAMVVAILALVLAIGGTAAGALRGKDKKKVKSIADREIVAKAGGLSVANAANLGGSPAAAYQQRVRWAIVSAAGAITAQSGGITSDGHNVGLCHPGCDYLNFGSPQTDKAIIATTNGASSSGFEDTYLCGGNSNPGGAICGPPLTINDTSHIRVQGFNAAGSPADEAYYVAVIG